jgi:hypothetical protein
MPSGMATERRGRLIDPAPEVVLNFVEEVLAR